MAGRLQLAHYQQPPHDPRFRYPSGDYLSSSEISPRTADFPLSDPGSSGYTGRPTTAPAISSPQHGQRHTPLHLSGHWHSPSTPLMNPGFGDMPPPRHRMQPPSFYRSYSDERPPQSRALRTPGHIPPQGLKLPSLAEIVARDNGTSPAQLSRLPVLQFGERRQLNAARPMSSLNLLLNPTDTEDLLPGSAEASEEVLSPHGEDVRYYQNKARHMQGRQPSPRREEVSQESID